MKNIANRKYIIIILVMLVLAGVMVAQLFPGVNPKDKSDSGNNTGAITNETTAAESAEEDNTSEDGDSSQTENSGQGQKDRGSQKKKSGSDNGSEGLSVGDGLVIELENNQDTDEVN